MLAETPGRVQRPSWLLPPDAEAGAARLQQKSSNGYGMGGRGPQVYFDSSSSDSVAERKQERANFFGPTNGIRLMELLPDTNRSYSESTDSARSGGLWQQAKTGNLPSRSDQLATVPAEILQSVPTQQERTGAPQITSRTWDSPQPDYGFPPVEPQISPVYQPVPDTTAELTEEHRRVVTELMSEVLQKIVLMSSPAWLS